MIEMTIVEMGQMSHCIATRSVAVMRWPAKMGSAFLLHSNVMEWITVETILMRQTVVSTELLGVVIAILQGVWWGEGSRMS